MTHWSETYIGLTHQDHGRSRTGADCWGLAYIVYAEQLGIILPEYLGYTSTEERAELAAIAAGATSSPIWAAVTGDVLPFDIALFRRGQLTSHFGIVIEPGQMLHMAEAAQSRIERYDTGYWATRLVGHYRHFERTLKDHS